MENCNPPSALMGAIQLLELNPSVCRPTINAVSGSGRFRRASTVAPCVCVASMPRTTQGLVRDVLAGLDVTDADPQAIHPQAFYSGSLKRQLPGGSAERGIRLDWIGLPPVT